MAENEPPDLPPPLPPGPPESWPPLEPDRPFPPPPPPPGPAWERRGPVFARIIDTVREVLFRPRDFFRAMPRTGGLGHPLLFYLLTATVGAVAGVLFQFALTSMQGQDQALMVLVLPFVVVFTPVLLAIAAFIAAGLYHVMLLLFASARHPFETTFRVVVYSGGATGLIGMIPICGSLIGAVWQIVVLIVGLSEAQETSTGKAAAAVLIPAVLCCCAFVMLTALAIGLGALGALAAAGLTPPARPLY
jgi:hypothetical protein